MKTFFSALALLACAIAIPFVPVFAHDVIGRLEGQSHNPHLNWLYGKSRTYHKGEIINCCTLGGNGDCREIPSTAIQEVEGGYRILPDGEFVPADEVTLSPDGKTYRCQHAGAISHCVFITRAGI
jgi:hypothetical protein